MKSYSKLTDSDGFLLDPEDWTKEFAIKAAGSLDINLTDDHWLVVNMIREQYESSMRVPELRHILKSMKILMGEKKAYLYAFNLKKKILRKLKKHGKKAQDLIKTIEFILERNF